MLQYLTLGISFALSQAEPPSSPPLPLGTQESFYTTDCSHNSDLLRFPTSTILLLLLAFKIFQVSCSVFGHYVFMGAFSLFVDIAKLSDSSTNYLSFQRFKLYRYQTLTQLSLHNKASTHQIVCPTDSRQQSFFTPHSFHKLCATKLWRGKVLTQQTRLHNTNHHHSF